MDCSDARLGKGCFSKKNMLLSLNLCKDSVDLLPSPLSISCVSGSRLNVGDSLMNKRDMVPAQRNLKANEEIRYYQ